MNKNEILNSFAKESGSLMFIVKKNNLKYYLSILFLLFSVLLSLLLLYNYQAWCVKDDFRFFFGLFITFSLPFFLYDYYESQKEHLLILNYNDDSSNDNDEYTKYSFWFKKANRDKVEQLILWLDFSIISVSLKGDDEIILISNKKLPWGNRKLVISDEFKDRKKEVLEFLKLMFIEKWH
jgi:hypothetical protein